MYKRQLTLNYTQASISHITTHNSSFTKEDTPKNVKLISENHPFFSQQEVYSLYQTFNNLSDKKTKKINLGALYDKLIIFNFHLRNPYLTNKIKQMYTNLGDKAIDFETFMKELNLSMGLQGSDEQLFQVFKTIDVENKGVIDYENLRSLAIICGYQFTDDEIKELLYSINKTKEDYLVFEKFKKAMKQKTFS